MENEEKAAQAGSASAAAKPAAKRPRRGAIVGGVIAAVVVVAGIGAFVWHEQPSFCNAICHTPMDGYLETYEAEPGQAATDKWGNQVADASGMLSAAHRTNSSNATCLSCHQPVISEQVSEGLSWASGNYTLMATDGNPAGELTERSTSQLTEARGVAGDEFCLNKDCHNPVIDRAIALHKMIRLFTLSGGGEAYLNFMGNEFGHPEWIDFPREGNGWSYKYARRQWNLVDNKELCYHYLGDFDHDMLQVLKSVKNIQKLPVQEIWHNDGDQILAFSRGELVFVFNFSPTHSYTDYGFMVPEGKYEVVLNTDDKAYGGNGFADDSVAHFTNYDALLKKDGKGWLKLYVPARSAVVLRKVKEDGAAE